MTTSLIFLHPLWIYINYTTIKTIIKSGRKSVIKYAYKDYDYKYVKDYSKETKADISDIISKVKSNSPNYKYIDLSCMALNKNQMKKLCKSLETNSNVEKISFGETLSTSTNGIKEKIQNKIFANHIKKLESNDPSYTYIDLSSLELSKKQMKELCKAVDNNSIVENVKWGDILSQNPKIKKYQQKIQNKIDNNSGVHKVDSSKNMHEKVMKLLNLIKDSEKLEGQKLKETKSKILSSLENDGLDLKLVDSDGMSALHLVAKHGWTDITKVLISNRNSASVS